jgi:large subunit ribosomal protein L9
MKVVFLKDVKGQGKKGDVKDISDGYVRNYLLPKGLVSVATDGSLKVLDQQQKSEAKRKEQEKQEAQALAAKLKEMTVTIKAKSGEGGRLFGAITSKQIAEELEKAKLKIDKRKILLDDAIRTMGVTAVSIKLHPDVTATLNVHVVEDK